MMTVTIEEAVAREVKEETGQDVIKCQYVSLCIVNAKGNLIYLNWNEEVNLTMRIFLCGGGSGEQTTEAIRRFSDLIDHKKPLLYIPLAMKSDLYPSCLEWIKGEMQGVNITNIDMVTSTEEIVRKELKDYSAIFIGGGNTFKLLYELKASGAFDQMKDYIEQDGIIFGGSAGAIIFGESLESCALDDENHVGLRDITGFNVLDGISLLCHYTNRTEEKDRKSTEYLTELSKRRKVIALPEEDTLFVNGNKVEVIGTRPYYYFENGIREERQAK